LGDQDRFSENKNALETIWSHYDGSTKVWTLSKIIKRST